jgi:membrane-bound serine protease (ClpP class)
MELNSPGFGLPGLVSVLAFSLFFFGNYLAGNLAGYELAVLLVLGLVLIAVEIFLFPGAILPGAVGATLVLVALGLAMVDRVDLEWKWTGLPGAESWYAIFRESLIVVALGIVGALGAIFAGLKFLPNTRLGSRLILQEAISSGAAIEAGRRDESGEAKSLVGLEGETTTDLVPSGKGMFDGRILDIVSDGQFIGKGEPVKVTAHEGSRIVVGKLE